jgi:hypothetical protein
MSEQEESPTTDYPHGRGYGHDYMRGGEVLGGYGYSQRQEYELPRGELSRERGSSGGDGGVAPSGDGDVTSGGL